MEFDICLPNNNEEEFILMAKKLAIPSLLFLYEFKDRKSFESKKQKKYDFDIITGLLVNEKNFQKARGLTPYTFAKNPARDLVESGVVTYFYDFEDQNQRDFLHHRNSGLNQVLCKIIKEKQKNLLFSYNLLLNTKNPPVILGRMMQNAKFAKKYKLKTQIASFAATPYELRAKKEKQALSKTIGLN